MKLTRKMKRRALKDLKKSQDPDRKTRKVVTYNACLGDLVSEKDRGIGIILSKSAGSRGEHSAWVLFASSGKRWQSLKTLKIVSKLH